MKKIISVIAAFAVILFSFSACSNAAILKGKYFSKDYRAFLRTMQKDLPVSVEYEMYSKKDGFKKSEAVVDSNKSRITKLVNALAEVSITGTAKSASNFNVKHYAFTTSDGKTYTFDFYGEYLKVENSYYKTDNYVTFTNLQPEEQKSGSVYLALDCIYYGSNTEKNIVYVGAKELTVSTSGKVTYGGFHDYKVSSDAKIISPSSSGTYSVSKQMSLNTFFKNFQKIKGEDNSAFIFKATVKAATITSLTFDYSLSSSTPLRD